MQYRLLLGFLLLALRAGAQDRYVNAGQAYSFDAGMEAYIFADTANVRASASPGAAVQDRLLQGATVKILKTGDLYELNGKSAPWCSISYRMNGVQRTGMLWSGLLSPRRLKSGDVQFLYGMRFLPGDTLPTVVDIKAFRGDSLAARTSFTIAVSETANGAHKAKVLPAKGLSGLQCLLYFYYSGEACAIPTDEQYIGWDGTRFIKLPPLSSSADAGAYAYEESFVFPADKGGQAGVLLHKARSQEYDDNDKPVKKSTKTTKYRWDAAGHRFVKQ